MYGVTLILVLAVVGGVIAFIGDRLGTRIGKKKLSIFGLRPRHTAVIVTIFTGICITTVTFGIMAAVSENVRTALFGMDRLNAMIADTRAARCCPRCLRSGCRTSSAWLRAEFSCGVPHSKFRGIRI